MEFSADKVKATLTTWLIFGALIVVGIIILLFIFRKKIKAVVMPSVYLVTGAVKTGKTSTSIWLAWKQYKLNVFKYYVGAIIYLICHHDLKKYYPYKPMFYTNIPVRFKHNRLTYDIIMRKKRIPNKSVVLIDEASLFADSMMYKNQRINDTITLFCKLYGHYSHGGSLVFNSQQNSDLHYAIRRSAGRYLYIYQSYKWPFLVVVKAREMVQSDDTGAVNQVASDLEESMRWVFYPSFIYKFYDQYCYSVFTDDLVYEVDYDYTFDKKDLKAKKVISLNKAFRYLKPREKLGDETTDE